MPDNSSMDKRRFAGILPTACLAAALAAGGVSRQGPLSPEVDVQALGPQAGSHVPDFSLPDQSGRIRTLASLMGPKGAMLVFSRSADW